MKRICQNNTCKAEFDARPADVRRGWGKFCSRSCKAIEQERRTGQYKAYKRRQRTRRYQEEYGGRPEFDSRGRFAGFQSTGLSIDDHDPNKD